MVLVEVIIICEMLSLPVKCIDKLVIKKSVPAMAAIYTVPTPLTMDICNCRTMMPQELSTT